MARKSICLIVFCIIGLCATFSYSAQATSSGADFLLVGIGARAIGMGEAFSSMTGDLDSYYWNPAGIADIEGTGLSLMYLRLLADANFMHLSFGQRLFRTKLFGLDAYGTIGSNIEYMFLPDITIYDEYGDEADKIKVNDLNSGLSYGMKIWNIYFGINSKYIRRTIWTYSANAIAFDVGLIYETGFWTSYKNIDKNLLFSVVAQNLGSTIKFISEKEPLPARYRLGVLYKAYRDNTHDLKFATDLSSGIGEPFALGFGTEYSYKDFVYARIGYKFVNSKARGPLDGISFGLGIRYLDATIDAAYSGKGDVGYTSYVSVAYNFKGFKAPEVVVKEIKADTKPATPTGAVAPVPEEKKPETPDVNNAKKAFENKDYKSAVNEVLKALERNPDDPEARELLKKAKKKYEEEIINRK